MAEQHLHELARTSPASALKHYLDNVQAPEFIQGALRKLLAHAANPNPERAAVGAAIADLTAANTMNAELDRRLGNAHVQISGLQERLSRAEQKLRAVCDAIDNATARALVHEHALGTKHKVMWVPAALWDAVLEARHAVRGKP